MKQFISLLLIFVSIPVQAQQWGQLQNPQIQTQRQSVPMNNTPYNYANQRPINPMPVYSQPNPYNNRHSINTQPLGNIEPPNYDYLRD